MLSSQGFVRHAPSSAMRVFVRGKKVLTVNASTQKVVGQLLALSASRKQPKLIRLCSEDLIKHRTIMNAWKIFQRHRALKRESQLEKQYNSTVNAMNDLQATSPELFEMANSATPVTRYPLDMRVPTDFPPNKPWVYNYALDSKK